MKFRLLYISFAITVVTSCREVGPPTIDFGSEYLEDATYIAVVEAPQQKNVLIEEFTGVSCPPCPSGHDVVKSIKEQHPGQVMVVAYHILNFPQAEPVHGLSKQDFRTQDATDISNNVYGGVGAMPVAGVDRVPKTGELLQARGFWPTSATEQLAKGTPLNIHLEQTYDATTQKVSLTTKLAFTQVFDKKLSLNVALIEDSIVDAQKNNLKVDTFYVHNYVLRGLITPISGTAVLDELQTKEAGRVYERKYSFTLNKEWVSSKCRIVVFAATNEPTNKEVIQATTITLTQ